MTSILKSIQKLEYNLQNKLPINVLFCDIQERFISKYHLHEGLIHTSRVMAEASKILKFNQIVSEHRKGVFGETIPDVKKHFYEKTHIFEKTRFAMLTDDQINKNSEAESVYVLLGIEAHVCITQTSVNILKNNKPLFIISDGVTSMLPGERQYALKNLRQMGAVITTMQSFFFLIFQDSNHPSFRSLLPLLKIHENEAFNGLLNEKI